ncbi:MULTISPECIES: alpha/beta fold hydrolase [unclassified Sphingomonas]|uniref:alpha/beta fold hydrolase n=2 Tax=Sphingomonas TaxID=13687 RepID=UPI001E64FE3A|nr:MULTISPECIES: alpha/beta fold hydrolase [unclassified Sphingomonas]
MPLFLAMVEAETRGDPDRRSAALAGLAAYQAAPRAAPPPPRPAVAHIGRTALRDHGGSGRPVVLVPSLINPPDILDLGDASLAAFLVAQGHRVLSVDWGTPGAADREAGLAAHVERLLVPLLATLDAPPVLVGYCLGGTLALAAACACPVAGLATIAAPWHHRGYGEEARGAMLDLWETARPTAAALGMLPMEALQSGFWRLDPARTVDKYVRFGRLAPDSAATRAFVRLEDWANAGAPLPFAFAAGLFEDFVAQDTPGRGLWQVAGAPATPDRLRCPAVEFVSTTDRIVPAATAARLADRRELALGHVGMIVGGRARTALWQPLADWIATLPPAKARA